MDQKGSFHKIELLVDKIIPYCVIFLLVLILIEFVFKEEVKPYNFYLLLLDYLILAIFCVDLVFKYLKVRKIPAFLRHYWLDILAVFPFFLVFRIFEEVFTVVNLPWFFKGPQTALHESIMLEKEGLRLVREAETVGKLSRARAIFRFLKPLQRLPRMLKIIPYFEKPTKGHHQVIQEIREERLKNAGHTDSKK